MKKVLLSANSSELFNKVSARESLYAGNTIEIAQHESEENDYIIAVGGDGTLNEVLNGILNYQQENPSNNQPILGILPLGTANDFVKSLNFTKGIDALLSLIKNQQHQKIDIGKLECFDEDRTSIISRYFINIADLGFGAHVVSKTNKGSSFFGANYTYTKAILSTFLTYKPKHINLRIDDQTEQKHKTLSLIFANGKYFASGICIAPHALLTDGKLAITQLNKVSMFDFLLNVGAAKKGKEISHPEAKYYKARYLEVSPEDKDSAVEADGEFIGYLPIKVNVIPKKISFLMAY